MKRAAIPLVISAILAALGALGYLFLRLEERDEVALRSLDRFERHMQRLDAGMPLDARRRRLLLGMRDRILLANSRIGLQDSYRCAEWILESTERHQNVSPLLLLSVGLVGSGLDAHAVGPLDARGLYRVRPSAGRMLARSLGWEFREEMLLDPEANMMLAALLLDVLITTHGDVRLALADYFGGPRSAGLLKATAEEVSEELQKVVLRVLDLYEDLQAELDASSLPLSLLTDDENDFWCKKGDYGDEGGCGDKTDVREGLVSIPLSPPVSHPPCIETRVLTPQPWRRARLARETSTSVRES